MVSSEQVGENLEAQHTWLLAAWNRGYMLGRQLSSEHLLSCNIKSEVLVIILRQENLLGVEQLYFGDSGITPFVLFQPPYSLIVYQGKRMG